VNIIPDLFQLVVILKGCTGLSKIHAMQQGLFGMMIAGSQFGFMVLRTSLEIEIKSVASLW
jgi:hypothetical protein